MKYILIIVISTFFASLPVFSYTSPGKPSGFVNDFAGVVSQETKKRLETELRAFSTGENPAVVVVTIKTLDGDPIEDYANRLFREWSIGDETKNNGVLFLVATDDRKMRIEVGYGLEGALTDIETKHIQDDIVRPLFRSNDFDSGIREAIAAIEEGLKGELTIPQTSAKGAVSFRDLESVGFLAILLLSYLASILGRSKSWWAGGIIGGVGGVIGWALTQWLYWVPLAAVFGLLFDYIVSKNYREHHLNHPAWWAGGGWGGWDRWGGSGGGFGGFGGGSSGGGGSSSSW